MRVRGLLVPAFLILLAGTTGCDLDGVLDAAATFREEFSRSYPLKPGAHLALETYNGSVRILGWEKHEIRISGVKYARSKVELEELKIEIEAGEQSVRIRAVPARNRARASGVRFFIRVPHRVRLDPIVSSNGPLRIEEVRGSARLETSNASVTLRQLEGSVEAQTSNGAINGSDLTGDFRLRTSNGGVRLERLKGTFDVRTSNSPITARIAEPAADRPIRLTTSNGSVELTLDHYNANPVAVATSNGAITLRLPASTGARIEASVSNASVHTDFELLGRLETKNRLEGIIGAGGPLIRLTTSNGTIRVLRS